MTPLDDARWDDLKTAYHRHCGELLEWLHVAYNGNLTSDLLGDVINETQHQGDTSTSMYAVAPHLLELATKYNTDLSRELVIHAGLIYASSTSDNAISCPAELLDDFKLSSGRGLQLVSALFLHDTDPTIFKYLLAATAGFAGHGRIGRFIEGLEFEADGVWCSHLDDPIPDIQNGG